MMQTKPGTPLAFEACENFRELGGYSGMNGKKVKYGVFYRTPALCNITTPHDLALFDSLNIKTVFDFRSEKERADLPDPTFKGVTEYAISAMVTPDGNEVNFDLEHLFSSTDGIGAVLADMNDGYSRMPFANKAYRAMFAQIIAGNTPLLFHCTAGKDRTGVAAALILRALGVSRADCIADYLITNICRKNNVEMLCKMLAKKIPAEQAAEYAPLLAGVKEESLVRSLDAIDAKYPDFETYLSAECGVSTQALTKMRADYLI
ncbi:MAG: tyrosine-protein phosphatase [Ruthenibacterium sp.]